ncbi:MAG: S-layer homology domain-containing protein [Oscillospiraceae bacterium]|jgi:hypothetical protein
MFKKTILLTTSVLALVLIAGSAFADGTAGGQSDPLVTKSYVDGVFRDEVLAGPLENLSDTMMAFEYKLTQSAGSAAASGVTIRQAAKSGIVRLIDGSGLSLLSGSATLLDGYGTLIDLTSGSTVQKGGRLVSGHRYLAADNTMSILSLSEPSRLALYGSTSYGGTAQLSFADVPENAWFYSDVLYAVNRSLISGRSAETFAPDDGLTIAEAIKLAACMNQLHSSGSVTLQNSGSIWYRAYVDYAKQNGIISGEYANYDAKITRSEFVKIFYNALPVSEYTQINSVADNAIPDVKQTDANAKEIYAFYRAGILIGSEGGVFSPSQSIRRSEVSAIMTRMFDPSARKSITLR